MSENKNNRSDKWRRPIGSATRLVLVAWLVALVLGTATVAWAQSATPADFGFGVMRVNGVPAAGRRPLLVILMDFADSRFRAPHTRDFYDRMFFGPATPNVAGYYTENSYGRFTWTRAGVIGPLRYPNDPATRRDESTFGFPHGGEYERQRALDLAATTGGVDFSAFDLNRNGVVTADELGVILINADPAPAVGAQTMGMNYRPRGSRVNLEVQMTAGAQGLSFATAAHEICHQLGAYDVYGSASLNDRLTLMAGTIVGAEDDRLLFHLDPFHKIQLGWIEPRIFTLGALGSCEVIEAVQAGGAVATPNRRPIVFYDPSRGTNEFFIIEYRTPRTPTGGGYDADAASQGLAVWYVKTRPDKTLPDIPGRIVAGMDGVLQTRPASGSDDIVTRSEILPGRDDSLQTRPAPGSDDQMPTDFLDYLISAPSGQRGGNRLWKSTDGEFRLRWFGGTDSRLRLKVGPTHPTQPYIEVEWGVGDAFTPRIQRLGSSAGAPGTLIALEGKFGLAQGSRIISLEGSGGRFDLVVESWTCSRVTVRIPAAARPGAYALRIFYDTSRRRSTPPFIFTIRS